MALYSILIPARNEEENILETISGIKSRLSAESIDYEILVINDGSTDKTFELVDSLNKKNPRIRVVNNQNPNGFGNAIKQGLSDFKGDFVIIAMADASDGPDDILKYIRLLEQGYDCCFGSRWLKESHVENYPKHKLYLNRFVNWCIRVLFNLNYCDVTNAFKGYSRKVINGISPVLSRHFNITVELPLKAIVRGYSYSVVPINWYGRRKGKSSLKIKEMGSRYLFIILYVFLEKLLCGNDYQKVDKLS